MIEFAENFCDIQKGICQQEIWRQKCAIAQTQSWVVSPVTVDMVIINAPNAVSISKA